MYSARVTHARARGGLNAFMDKNGKGMLVGQTHKRAQPLARGHWGEEHVGAAAGRRAAWRRSHHTAGGARRAVREAPTVESGASHKGVRAAQASAGVEPGAGGGSSPSSGPAQARLGGCLRVTHVIVLHNPQGHAQHRLHASGPHTSNRYGSTGSARCAVHARASGKSYFEQDRGSLPERKGWWWGAGTTRGSQTQPQGADLQAGKR